MKSKKRILIADDSVVDRMMLGRMLQDRYEVVFAEDGRAALARLDECKGDIAAILLDLVMPVMDGYNFLTMVKNDPTYHDIPIIVMTQADTEQAEIRALSLGATDFLAKPYRPAILRQRLANTISFYETIAVRNTLERDDLTGLYNRATFFKKVAQYAEEWPGTEFELLAVDVERFRLVNELFGTEEGDRLLGFLATKLTEEMNAAGGFCARFSADQFAALLPEENTGVEALARRLQEAISSYPLGISLTVRTGACSDEAREGLSGAKLYDRARLALQGIRGKYDCYCAHYDHAAHQMQLQEAQMIAEMGAALQNNEFEVYYQPKYNLTTGLVDGAEALVRWNHPRRGLIGPEEFVPLFEKNGFISALDIYIWNTACADISRWARSGAAVVPISLNVSRVDLYNPALCDTLDAILKKYDIQQGWVELEITETGYTENPQQLIRVVHELKHRGYLVEMDDFGSGNSSLNMLSEVPVDVRKIDLRFLQNESDRNHNILHFVVGLAKWLNLSVVAEGIETREQAAFLRSMGCNHGQGYYFSRPLKKQAFEQLLTDGTRRDVSASKEQDFSSIDVAEIWHPKSQFNLLFNSYVGALAIFEYTESALSLVRGNENYYVLTGEPREAAYHGNANSLLRVHEADRGALICSLARIAKNNGEESGDYRLAGQNGRVEWIHLRFKVVFHEQDRVLLLSSLENCTRAGSSAIFWMRAIERGCKRNCCFFKKKGKAIFAAQNTVSIRKMTACVG